MIGQKHYVIMLPDLERSRHQYWRKRRNQNEANGWTYDIRRCKSYRSADDALRAARQIDVPPGTKLEVVELETVVSLVCYRLETLEIAGVNA